MKKCISSIDDERRHLFENHIEYWMSQKRYFLFGRNFTYEEAEYTVKNSCYQNDWKYYAGKRRNEAEILLSICESDMDSDTHINLNSDEAMLVLDWSK